MWDSSPLYDMTPCIRSTPCFIVSPKGTQFMLFIGSILSGGSHFRKPLLTQFVFKAPSLMRHALGRLITSGIFSSLAVWKPHC